MKNWIRSYFVVTKLPGRNFLGKKKLKVFYPSSKNTNLGYIAWRETISNLTKFI
jgi:hypothetical protein